MQQYLISDSNVIIDMEVAGLIELIFNLPYSFAVPDMLYHDELREQHDHLPSLGLQLLRLEPETMVNAMGLIQQYPKPGRNDLFALALARQEECPLVTGDMDLRKAATKEQIELRGSIWLIEELVMNRIISVDRARRAYEVMAGEGRRLPQSEIRLQLERLEQHFGS